MVGKFYPKVSIVIPVYNGANYLREAINSALVQDYDNLEVIVVNDGSDDGGQTDNIVLSYINRVLYLKKPNGGVASALNMGIQHMTGDYFSWLSHDDLYCHDKISSQIALLSGLEDKTTIVSCGMKYVYSSGKEKGRFHPFDFYSPKQLNKPLFALLHGCISGCTLLIHRSHFERVGFFDSSLLTTQDFDLWFRMMRGQYVAFHPSILSISRIHEKQGSRKSNDLHVEECDKLWISIIKTLSTEEMREIGKSVYLFYRDVHRHLLRNSNYDRAAAFTEEYAIQALQKEYDEGRLSKRKADGFMKKDFKIKQLLLYDRELAAMANEPKWKRLCISLRVEGLHIAGMRLLRAIQGKLERLFSRCQ